MIDEFSDEESIRFLMHSEFLPEIWMFLFAVKIDCRLVLCATPVCRPGQKLVRKPGQCCKTCQRESNYEGGILVQVFTI